MERHREFEAAAELATTRELRVALAIRLWWLARRVDTALQLARWRGGWAAAIGQAVDRGQADLASGLRRAWVGDLLAAGDLRQAIEVAWPDPSARPLVVPVLGTAIAGGGPRGAALLAHLLQVSDDPAAAQAALALLTAGADPAATRALIPTLAKLPAADPVTDRRLAGSALLALSTMPNSELTRSGVIRAFTARADPLLVADLPPRRPSPQPDWADLQVELPEVAGELPVIDAVPLPTGILVSFGDLGMRLLTADRRP